MTKLSKIQKKASFVLNLRLENPPQRKIFNKNKQRALSFLPFSFSGVIRKYEDLLYGKRKLQIPVL